MVYRYSRHHHVRHQTQKEIVARAALTNFRVPVVITIIRALFLRIFQNNVSLHKYGLGQSQIWVKTML